MAEQLPRSLHPGAWWLWALGLAAAASRTTNPLLLALILAVACLVVAAAARDAAWALGFRSTCGSAAFVVTIARRLPRRARRRLRRPRARVTLPQVPAAALGGRDPAAAAR